MADPGAIVDCGVAESTLAGEPVTGDRHVVTRHPGGVILAVIDGLGHGTEAARAAETAAALVSRFPSGDVVTLVGRCHEELRGTRGVVMTVVSLIPAAGSMSFVGVGNVQGMVVAAPKPGEEPERDFVPLRGGVVGHILPALRPSLRPLSRGDTLILATDGIGIEFTTDEQLGGPPQAVADLLPSASGDVQDAALAALHGHGDEVRRTLLEWAIAEVPRAS